MKNVCNNAAVSQNPEKQPTTTVDTQPNGKSRLNRWNPDNKAVVLDGTNCRWSRKCIGLPSVVKVDKRLAIFHDAPGGNSNSHMKRDVGLAWLDLPLTTPDAVAK
jgi:hypothetical protein